MNCALASPLYRTFGPIHTTKLYKEKNVAECRRAATPLSSYSTLYNTSGLSKEVYYFVVSQGAQKLPAKVQMKSLIY